MIEVKDAILKEEMLTDDQLENIVGGTRAETRELSIALNKTLYGLDFSILDINHADEMLYAKSDLEKELAAYEVTTKISVGKNGTGEGEVANEYYNKYGVKIPHEKMVQIFGGN